MPNAVIAQSAIPITGGTIVVDGLNTPEGTTATFVTPQGSIDSSTTAIVSTNGWLNPCCSIVGHMSGVGYSANGPVVFSNLPWVVETPAGTPYTPVGGAQREIVGGVINGAYDNPINPRFNGMHTPGQSIMFNLSVNNAFDASAGGFSFEPLPPPAAPTVLPPPLAADPTVEIGNFELPEFSTVSGNPEQQDRIAFAQQESDANYSPGNLWSPRLNGIHTRLIPAWTPGLYQ